MPSKPATLKELLASGWKSRPVKAELRDNLTAALAHTRTADELFPGIVGYQDTVIPEIVNAVLAGHDILFLGEKGQAKSRLMRLLTRFLDAGHHALWVTGDEVYGGNPKLRAALEERATGYVLAVACSAEVDSVAELPAGVRDGPA